jgi:hypothetical protein
VRKRRVWAYAGVGLVLGCALLAAFLEPTQTVRAYLAGEAFYRGRPTRYWREVLRAEGPNRQMSDETRRLFLRSDEALPVLKACARDPDPNVRRVAVTLAGRSGLRTQAVLDLLRNALHDEVPAVRLNAAAILASWGRMARAAIPDLAARLHDPEDQITYTADIALWQIDVPSAVQVCGWRTFHSAGYRFSVMLPAVPTEEDKPLPFPPPPVSHTFMTHHTAGSWTGPTVYFLTVTEYPVELVKTSTDEERIDASRDMTLFGTGGKLIEDKPITLNGLKGRELTIEAGELGVLRSRQFWVGRKKYLAGLAYKPEFLNARAADYFLDSFRLEDRGKKTEE